MDIRVEFGKRVRELRRRRKLTQEGLARRCPGKFEMQSISEIELGNRNCTLETIAALAKGLSCDPADLFLFSPKAIGKALSALDHRVLDLWKGADDVMREKAIRVLSELF